MTVIVPYVQLNITLNCHSPFGNKMAASLENVLHVIFLLFTGNGNICPLLPTCVRNLYLTLNYHSILDRK